MRPIRAARQFKKKSAEFAVPELRPQKRPYPRRSSAWLPVRRLCGSSRGRLRLRRVMNGFVIAIAGLVLWTMLTFYLFYLLEF